MLPKLPREKLLELCRRMLLIRHFEESLIGLHDQGRFEGHYHVYIGQEATAVPALSCLGQKDILFTTHRNHGHLLARGADPDRALAEIFGRATGYSGGKAGTLHGCAPDLNFPLSSGIVAGLSLSM